MTDTTPLILVFYLDREMMNNPDIIGPYSESINQILTHKNANAIALFLPTDGEEWIDCINPQLLQEADMVRVNTLIDDIKKNFNIGEEINKDLNIHDLDLIPDTDLENDKID